MCSVRRRCVVGVWRVCGQGTKETLPRQLTNNEFSQIKHERIITYQLRERARQPIPHPRRRLTTPIFVRRWCPCVASKHVGNRDGFPPLLNVCEGHSGLISMHQGGFATLTHRNKLAYTQRRRSPSSLSVCEEVVSLDVSRIRC